LNADGKGNFAATSMTGSAVNLGDTAVTQAASGLTYSVTANGTGTIDFGAASLNQLVSGTQTVGCIRRRKPHHWRLPE
jgi:hypothetical protein